MSEEWDWELTDTADRQFDGLDEYAQERISSKLDEIVTDQWRNPTDYLNLVCVDAVVGNVSLVVNDVPVIVVHASVGWQSISPDLSQRLGEVVCLVNNWSEIVLVVAPLLSCHHTKHVAAGRDERRLVTLVTCPAGASAFGRPAAVEPLPRQNAVSNSLSWS